MFNPFQVHFKDGTSDEYDAIIKCTGYLHKFDFLGDDLKLNSRNVFVPPGLYKQTVSMRNNRLFFIGMQDLFYTYTLFQAQGSYHLKWCRVDDPYSLAYLCRDIILNKFVLPDKAAQEQAWKEDDAQAELCKDAFDQISFQTKYVNGLTELTGEGSYLTLTSTSQTQLWKILNSFLFDCLVTIANNQYKRKLTIFQSWASFLDNWSNLPNNITYST